MSSTKCTWSRVLPACHPHNLRGITAENTLCPVYSTNQVHFLLFFPSVPLPPSMLTTQLTGCVKRGVSKSISNTRMCPWCNGYRRRKWARRHEFKPWTSISNTQTRVKIDGFSVAHASFQRVTQAIYVAFPPRTLCIQFTQRIKCISFYFCSQCPTSS